MTEERTPPGFVAGIGLLFGAVYFVQSVGDPASGLIAQPVRSLLNDWGESPAAIAGFMAAMALPWSLKPLLALLSDFVPLFGSRRRGYLLVATGAAAIGLGILYAAPLTPGARWILLMLLFVPTLGIAFSDVLVDALMIEVGKPRNLTGRLQSVQWFAASLGLLCSGIVGGYLTSRNRHDLAFLICAALWSASLVLTVAFVHEPRRAVNANELRATAGALRSALAAPGLLTICAITFLWDGNPLSYSVNYLHLTRTLGLDEQVYGSSLSLFSAGGMIASVAYGLYCRRIAASVLLHGAIAAGIVANVLYWWVAGAPSLYVVSMLGGLAYMTGSLILLDLAARLVPLPVAATVFALIMALANLGSSLAEAMGGYVFEGATTRYGGATAYGIVIVLSVLVIASCWSCVPLLRRQVPQWWR